MKQKKNEEKAHEKHKYFFEQVYDIVLLIPKGRVTSYGAIATCLGTKLTARLVGWAMSFSHTQQRPIPAHRVVNRIGMLSGKHHFSPPSSMQKRLEKEGVKVKNDKVMHFKDLFWEPMKEITL